MNTESVKGESPDNSDSDALRAHVETNVRELLSGAEELLRTTASYSGAEIEAARSRLKGQLDAVREQTDWYEQLISDNYRRVSQATDKYVRNHAWQSIGAAAALGVLLGKSLMSTTKLHDVFPFRRH
jgi:ElaB/YqjD/DUF883 family membrane-anchored ribosome-binding protein